MHQVPLLISEWSPIRPNFKLLKGNVNTRSSQAQPLYKIDKLVATGGPFKPELSILESCCASRYGKGQGCLLTKFWSLESRAQGGGKHMNRVQFLELFEPFWFYKDNGSTLKLSTCTYPHWFPNHPQSVPISSYGNGKATSTRAVLKQNLSIKSKNLCLGVLQAWTVHFGVLLCLTIWTVAKMFEACIDQILELEGKEAGNIWTESNFWNFLIL